ncbi:hypothetical protein VTN77DRAFT_3428 [Rasamsonia byssochlamydoides]|uniref:uncharacterized protein n=1 Tax=Rasamsonia byssochlamydoides TaxID=89139 RepID=UPI00374251B4
MYFQIPWVWDRLYRAILQSGRDEPKFAISGVALCAHWTRGFLRVPRNQGEVIIGDPYRKPEKFVEAYVANYDVDYQPLDPCGYVIHERCWVLLTRILDPHLIEQHLGLLVQVFRQTWGDYQVYELDGLICEILKWRKMEQLYGVDKLYRNPRKYMDLHANDPVQHLAPIPDELRDSGKLFALRDPLNVVEVRDLIKQAVVKRRKRKTGEKRSKSLSTRKPLNQDDNAYNDILLPVDIILTILDFLSYYKDIRNTLQALPSWGPMIPNLYWRSRFPKEVIFEYEEIASRDDLDWQDLYFKAGDLLETSHGLRNRQRIMKVLEGIKALFLELVMTGE